MTALARHASRFLAPVLLGSIVALASTPTVAAPADRAISKSQGSSQTPATCRPKWPHIVLTCVA